MKAVYPGSFDPFTNGHLDILERSLRIFSEITILVAGTSRKTTLLSPEERVQLIREVTKGKPNVKVDSTPGLIMEYARTHSIGAVIRGLRTPSDFEYEYMMATMNKNIHPQCETVFMMSSQGLYFVSSTMIKELYHYGGDISPYVPAPVLHKLREKIPSAKRSGNEPEKK
ncbi:MAG: pantetheine-phosphate adenylyltransferase [Proteobacteria bacterium]|nr:pantetheine-phosphate adenylyltransferase [Pseudomonadota bacterium]